MTSQSPPVDPNAPNPAWVKKIRLRARAIRADNPPNLEINKRTLQAWKMDSPRMWARLTGVSASFPNDLATVVQAEMFQMERDLMEGGMYYTDAREQAERETLMMEPENELTPDELAQLEEEEAERLQHARQ